MVLYCVVHPANIYKALVHRFKYHSNDETIMFVEKPVDSLYCPKFNNVQYYKMPDYWSLVRYSDDPEKIKEHINITIGKFFKDLKFNPYDFNAIYVLFDMYNPFILYFELNHITYMSIECIDNQFNDYLTQDFYSHRPKQEYAYNCLVKNMHLQDGQGNYCIKGYLFSKNSIYLPSCKTPVEIFDYYNLLVNMSGDEKKLWIQTLHLDDYNFDTVLLLNSIGWTRDIMVLDNVELPPKLYEKYPASQVAYFFKFIIDYYFKNSQFCVKLHPTSDYNLINDFSNFIQIPNYLPFEFFVLTGRNFCAVSLAKTTAIDVFNLAGYKTVCFGRKIMSFMRRIHFVYLALSFIKYHRITSKVNVYGINIEQLNYFKYWAYKEFQSVNFEQLTVDNAKDAEYIIAVSDPQFSEYIKQVNNQCIILTDNIDKLNNIMDFYCQKMEYSIFDISQSEQEEIQRFSWYVLTKETKNKNSISNFCYSYTLENSKLRIQSVPYVATYMESSNLLKEYKKALQANKDHYLKYFSILQLYYEAEINGYNLKKFFEDNDLFAENVNMAFFAVDEFGLMVYRICERCGIHFSALVSDIDRNIEHTINSNFTQALEFKSLDKGINNQITHIFMGTIYNAQHIDMVKKYSKKTLIFDSISMHLYTRACVLDRISELVKNHPGVYAGIFNTPFISQVAGEHSLLEEYFSKNNVQNILKIKDETMSDQAKKLCYKAYGFNDQYIEEVCSAQYKIVCYNGTYLLEDCTGKYVNILNHRRVTTDAPSFFTNTIYFFGHSCVIGYHVDDSGTIESNLQRIINENNLPYIVQNCGNAYSSHYDWIFGLTKDMQFQSGDILLFCTHMDWQTEQYLKNNDKKFLSNILGIYTTPIFQRPHDHGEVFTDDHHFNGKGYSLIAQKIFDDIKAAGFFDKDKNVIDEEPEPFDKPSVTENKVAGGGN